MMNPKLITDFFYDFENEWKHYLVVVNPKDKVKGFAVFAADYMRSFYAAVEKKLAFYFGSLVK